MQFTNGNADLFVTKKRNVNTAVGVGTMLIEAFPFKKNFLSEKQRKKSSVLSTG